VSSDRVIVFDTTLRDGEQAAGTRLGAREKLELAQQLARLGVDVIEAGFPISSPADFEAVQLIANQVHGPTICGLSRAVEQDIDAAGRALAPAKKRRIHTGLGISDIHIASKFRDEKYGKTLEEKKARAIEMGIAAVKHALNYTDDVEFYCEDSGRADKAYLFTIVEAVIDAGARTVNIPDTTGYSIPEQFAALIAELIAKVPNSRKAIISVHCHDDLGMSVANSLACVKAGARQIEGTINGVGERAGNTSLEEIAMILRCHKNLGVHTDINTQHIMHSSRLVSSLMNMPVQPNKAVVGRNAFAHSSGIHQDGVLKNRENYEIMDPKDVGIDENSIVLTARSGRAALKHRLHLLGVEIGEERLQEVYQEFLKLADRKKVINDEDILLLTGEERSEKKRIKLDHLQVVSGKGVRAVASITLDIAGEKFEATASGNGPVDAGIKALKRIINREMTLQEFLIQAIAKGSDDTGKVHMQVEHQGSVYYGFSGNTDIITASIEAYIDAINKFID